MPGNTDASQSWFQSEDVTESDLEKEKCLERLNEMQQFLPFLDFMIEKIKRKSDLSLECQLSKFQHIRNIIIEKNRKYSLESLNNIKDILQKLLTKLDYKVKKEVLERKDDKQDSNVAETTVYTKKSKCLEVKSKESKELNADRTSSRHDTDTMKTCASMDVLTSSRQKPFKTASGREFETGSYKKIVSVDSTDNKNNFGNDIKGTKYVEKKEKNNTISDIFSNYELSDISDDDIILAEDIENNSVVVESSKNNVKHSVDGTLPKKGLSTKFDRKTSEPFTCSISYSINDVSSKQKLRERLSADIAEVHKVPGKSVGGSLRSLKDIKSSKVKETVSEPQQKKSYPRERIIDHRSDSLEPLSDSEKDRDVEKYSRKEWTNKDSRSRDRERKKDEKHYYRIEEEKEDRTVHSNKHSSRSEKKVIQLEEKKKKRKKRLEIDRVDDAELIAFVRENISDLPHLSKLNPDELRKAARSSFAWENIDSDADEIEEKKEISAKKQKEMNDESQLYIKETVPSKRDTEIKEQIDIDCDDDEYSLRLIEELTPSSRTRLESEQPEARTKSFVSELQSHENPGSVENKDSRIGHSVHSSEKSEDHHRLSHRMLKSSKSRTESAGSHRHHNSLNDRDYCDVRVVKNEQCDDKQKHPSQDLPSNNQATRLGLLPEHAKVHCLNTAVGHSNHNVCDKKTYDECKPLKKHGKESADHRRLSLDSKLSSIEKSISQEVKSIEIMQGEVKVTETLSSPPSNIVNPCDDRNSKVRSTKTPNPKISSETCRNTIDGDESNAERTDKSCLGKFSPQNDEKVSSLEDLHDNNRKPGSAGNNVMQDFKIPKRSRSSSLDQQKLDDKDSQISSCEINVNKLSSDHTSQECDEKHSTINKVCVISSTKKSVTDLIQQESVEIDVSAKNNDSELVTNPTSINGSVNVIQENLSVDSKNISLDQMPTDKDRDNEKNDLDQVISEKNGNESVKPSEDLKNATEIVEEKSATETKCAETDKIKHDKSSVETSREEMENNVKPKAESDLGGKSTITEEITQELVEALIRKSFESGEGELLLAKAKLFKELALKLNSKKLKTIQKIINSESDSSSSLSESSTECEKRKKRKMKKKNNEETGKMEKKNRKKTIKNKRCMDTSSESEDEIANDEKCNSPANSSEIQSETVKEKMQSEKSSETQIESSTKPKRSQRKTKLLEQIFNESPAKNFELSLDNKVPTEKESEHKIKTKGKRGKTELDRLHEDVRNMFISSGVVTATGQRMCRILRESGGKMNNLDLVRESAKMVEEEKLASKKIRKLTTRSRSRSLDRKTLRDRSHNRNLLSGVDEDILKVTKKKPIILLKKICLEKMSYAYKITDVPGSLTVKRGRNVAKRGRGFSRGMIRSMKNEEIDLNKRGRIYLVRNLRRCLNGRGKIGKREYKRKLTEIIQKLPLKMAKIQHLKIGDKLGIGKRNVKKQIQKNEVQDKKSKTDHKVEESSEILEYAFEKTKSSFSCLLCGFHTKSITAHYKTMHPDSEVLISRLENSEAMKAIQESKELNYDITTLEQASSLEIIKRRVKNKLSNSTTFFCRMCSYGNMTNINQFFSHVSAHTGEYRFMCPIEGCNSSMVYRDMIRSHVIAKHQKHKSLANKVLELFPFPNEHGILFGYLCSRCNYVQILKNNVESHIQRVHGGVEDVRAIKIDMSGKAPMEKGMKNMKRKTRKQEKGNNENVEEHKKKEDGEVEDLTSSESQSNDDDDDDDVEFEDPADEDYMYESDVASDSCSSNGDDENKKNGNLKSDKNKYRPRRTRSSILKVQNNTTEGNSISETPNNNQKEGDGKDEKKPASDPEETVVKSEILIEEEAAAKVSETVSELNKWIVGPLEVTKLTNGAMIFNCRVGQCSYTIKQFDEFEKHVLSGHESAVWTGVCDSCDISESQKQGSLQGIYKISDVWDHLAKHITSKEKDLRVQKIEDIKKELLDSVTDLNSTSIEECSKQSETENGDGSFENVPYPERPLLRVRSLMGDRLSKPKSLSDEEIEEPVHSTCSVVMTESTNESDKINSEPLFTIKDVRSLNVDDENGCLEEANFSQEVEEFFPPNAEVIAGKPILIRSCPSPKITISSEPESAFPISVAQTKQGIEVGQLIQMIPQPQVSEVTPPLDLNKLGFVATTSIRILSPMASTTPTVIVPTFASTPGLKALPKVLGTTQTMTLKESKKPALKPILSKPLLPPVNLPSDVDVVIQPIEKREPIFFTKSPRRKKLQQPISIVRPRSNMPSQGGNSPGTESNPTPVKGEQRHAIPISGRNIKDAKIYSQMLTKKKLCQLFKCMAIECSFTCNNETIFTQHIGLHEAQQRIRGKKKPLNKFKKIFNWQQCAYCCEVLIHTGSALSQHILTEHGHCLYQCAYCFYRAVSPTYVDLHQNTVHENIIKDTKKLMYKCKPVPGAVMTKQFEKQIKPQHIRPYQCEHCGHKFLIIQHFIDHLTKKHQSVTAYCCHICKILCFKVDRLLAHYKLHSYSMYQCAYCLHGTENQKEMLYHLWNFHFSQPPVIYARILEDKAKTDCIGIDDLKLLTFDNEPIDEGHNLEEAGSEAEQDPEKKDGESISVDLSAIVSELGISVDDAKKTTVAAKTNKEMESRPPPSVSLETMLPNAQFSSECDAKNDTSTLLISSTLSSVTGQEKEGRDASVPIGQLPIEVLDSFHPGSSQEQDDSETLESIDKILLNLQKNNSSVSVSPVIENKIQGDVAPIRTVHKLPPTVPVNRSVITSVYPSKKVAIVKKVDEIQTKEPSPVLLHQLCTNPRISTDLAQPQGVILAVPVMDTLKSSSQGKDETGATPSILNTTGVKRAADDPPDTLKNVKDGSILKRLCLGNPSTPAVFTIRPVQESSLKISDIRSLSNEKTSPPLLQPPVIRVEDFIDKGEGSGNGVKLIETDQNKLDLKEKNIKPPLSPEVIILEPEEDKKNSRNELLEVIDSEDDVDDKKGFSKRKAKKIMTDKDLEIRKQMEQLRNQMENETDCLLLDDDANDCDGQFNQLGKSEESRNCFSMNEETNPSINMESISIDSQHPSEESSDKTILYEGNTQDGDSRTNDSEDSKNSKIDESESANEKCIEKKSEKNIGEDEKKEELTGKELYICGNEKCNFTAETDVELKDHLYICDFSRESTTLVCPHCSKHFKLSPPFVEHLKIHGEKKYSCGMCDLRSPWESVVTRHMKHKHKISQLKTLPHVTKSGHFVIYPKNFKKEKQFVEMQLYSPGDEDKLPLQSIYQENVNCAKCPYFTKVRSNMVRHLKIHIKSVEAEGSIVVPSTAPTNPVPCLDTKERMFDKMTNLAASSQLAQANKDKFETLSSEEEAKLPQFVPEQMRHKCCSPDCNYLTIDDNMLKHHIKALHDEINVYSCPHCRETVHVEFRFVPLDKIGQHLKYHDARLYKCYHCTYFHHQKYIVEKHALEKHPERRFSVFTVREPKVDSSPAVEEEHQNSSSKESIIKMWKCGICDNCESTMRVKVIEHLTKVHNCKSKFKCKFCDTKSSQQSAFAAHFASKHIGQKVEYVKALIQFSRSVSEVGQNVVGQEMSNDYFDTTPLWQRDAPRIRHIRGILIEEEEVKTKKTKKGNSDSEVKSPPDMFHCPLCTDVKKVFRSKSAEAFRTHLYQELNYYQYACILCGKMFVDRKEFEKHHSRSHSNQELSLKQTKEDTEIIFWVDKVVAKQQTEIIHKKRNISCTSEDCSTAKKKKIQPKTVSPTMISTDSPKTKANKSTKLNSSLEVKKEIDREKVMRRTSEDKSEFMRQTRSVSAIHSEEQSKKCPHCQYNAKNLDNLKNHIKLKHLKMGKWLCSYCEESFLLEKNAMKHCKNIHPNEVPKASLNPDEVEDLKDDFWLVEYGFGREKQTKRVNDEEKSSSLTEKMMNKKSIEIKKKVKSEITTVYSCGYCSVEVADQNSIVEHFEIHHKDVPSEVGNSVIYYQCSICAEKLMDFDSLNLHAKNKHPNVTLQFEIRKVYKYDLKECLCVKCHKQPCECSKSNRTMVDGNVKEGCYQCPQCFMICTSYLDCIDHFNEHYPRYACSDCSQRFFTAKETKEHQEQSQHNSPYSMTIPSETMLTEYKLGVKIMKNGIWVPLKTIKRSNSSDDTKETKKLKNITARKSTNQLSERSSHTENESHGDSKDSKNDQIHVNVKSQSHSEIHN